MRRTHVIVLATLAGVLVAGALVFFYPFESPALGRALVKMAGDALGMELEARSFGLQLSRGIILREARGTWRGPDRTLTFALDELVFAHRILPLLSGVIAVEAIVLEHPSLELAEGPATLAPRSTPNQKPKPATAGAAAPSSPSSRLSLRVDRIVVRDGTLSLRPAAGAEESGETRIAGLELRLHDVAHRPDAPRPIAAISAHGELEARELVLGEHRVEHLRSQVSLADGRLELKALALRHDYGRIEGKVDVDLNPSPFAYELTARLEDLDVGALLAAEGGGFGPGTLELTGHGSGPETRDFVGNGSLMLAPGKLPETPLFAAVDLALGQEVWVAGAPYQVEPARFTVRDDRIHIAPCSLTTAGAGLTLQGALGLDGALGLGLAMRTLREGLSIRGEVGGVLDLLEDEQGFVTVPLRVRGTFAAPEVLPDPEGLRDQAKEAAKRRVREEVGRRAGELTRRLFNRN